MTASERLADMGYEDVIILSDYGYDDALIGVTEDNRAVYDFDAMVDWLCRNHNFSETDAIPFERCRIWGIERRLLCTGWIRAAAMLLNYVDDLESKGGK